MFAVTYYLVLGMNVRARHAFCPAQVHYYCYCLLLLYAFLEQINYNDDDDTDVHAMWASEPEPKWALWLKE